MHYILSTILCREPGGSRVLQPPPSAASRPPVAWPGTKIWPWLSLQLNPGIFNCLKKSKKPSKITPWSHHNSTNTSTQKRWNREKLKRFGNKLRWIRVRIQVDWEEFECEKAYLRRNEQKWRLNFGEFAAHERQDKNEIFIKFIRRVLDGSHTNLM